MIYLDYNATTPLDPAVLEAMLPYLSQHFGNPSSVHQMGRYTRQAIETARMQVAALVNVAPQQVVFTATGSEANALALKGFSEAQQHPGVIAVSIIEHSSVLNSVRWMKTHGWKVCEIPCDENSVIAAEQLDLKGTDIVSIGLANNETGVVQDMTAIASKARAQGAVVHTDAIQAVGKISVDFEQLGVHLLVLSSHKMYGPLGAAALVMDRSIALKPLVEGGGQEYGLRSGTENIPAIVGFGAAAELAQKRLKDRAAHTQQLRDRFETAVKDISSIKVLGQTAPCRLPNTTLISKLGVDSEWLLMQLDRVGIMVSSGSACASGTGKPSHVLQAMHLPTDIAEGVIRISFGEQNTIAEVDALVRCLMRSS